MADATEESVFPNHPLRKLAEAIQRLADSANSENPHIKISQLVYACRLFPTTNFGMLFQFLKMELTEKVNKVEQGARHDETVRALFEREIAQGSAKISKSASRNVIRLKRLIEMQLIFFEQILANEGSDSIVDPMTIAYNQVFGAYHVYTVKKAINTFLKYHLPTKSRFLDVLNEDGNSIREPFEKHIAASKVVIQHVEHIFLSTELGVELLRLI